jgi:hypothetical protein
MAAVAIVVVFVAAVANAGEFCAASGTFNMIEICVFVDADGVAASGAFHFNEIVITVAIAITIVIVAIAAIAVVTVDFFFESAEIFVNFFDVGIEVFCVFLELVNFLCDVSENVEDRLDHFVFNVEAFSETFDVCNFFRNVHCIHPFFT